VSAGIFDAMQAGSASPTGSVRNGRPDAGVGTEPLLLPVGTRLVHIGPPKTGTTALQSAFHAARDAAEQQGVHYAGRSRHSVRAIQAVLGKPGFYTDGAPPPIDTWMRLVTEVERSRADRVVISSEFLADARPDAIRRVVDDLGGPAVHVVVTLRSLARIIPSQWQQYVQSNMRVAFDDWLDAVFNQTGRKMTPSFWYRHRHDQLIGRWLEVVGPERATAIVLDEQDHDMVLRTFERLTGLRTGTLVAEPDLANRSLTLPEVEAVRAFNIAFRREGLGRALHSRVMNFGAARYLRLAEPDPEAPRLEPPQWALDRAGEIAREMVAAISASGVRVVGDLEALAVMPPSRRSEGSPTAVPVPPVVAARMAMGVLIASGAARGQERMPGVLQFAEPPELVRLTTRQLAVVLARRARDVARRRLTGFGRGLPGPLRRR